MARSRFARLKSGRTIAAGVHGSKSGAWVPEARVMYVALPMVSQSCCVGGAYAIPAMRL